MTLRRVGKPRLLRKTHFDKPGVFDDPIALLRLLHYAPIISDPDKGIWSAPPHRCTSLVVPRQLCTVAVVIDM